MLKVNLLIRMKALYPTTNIRINRLGLQTVPHTTDRLRDVVDTSGAEGIP